MVTVGDRVSEGTYRVHSRFRRVVNFQNGSRLVSVVDFTVGPGPVNIVTDGVAFGNARDLRVGPQGAWLDGVRVGFGSMYSSGIDLAGAQRQVLRRNLPEVKAALLEASSPRSLAFLLDPARCERLKPGFERALAAHMMEGVRRLFGTEITCGRATAGTETRRYTGPHCRALSEKRSRGQRRARRPDATETFRCHGSGNATVTCDMSGRVASGTETRATSGTETRRYTGPHCRADGVKMIAGCGFGLTPSGDDFLCGMLVGFHVTGQVCGMDFSKPMDTLYRAAETKNLLSGTFLGLAYRGRVDWRTKALLRAIVLGERTATRECTDRVIAVGETSGADMLTGLYMTLERYA